MMVRFLVLECMALSPLQTKPLQREAAQLRNHELLAPTLTHTHGTHGTHGTHATHATHATRWLPRPQGKGKKR